MSATRRVGKAAYRKLIEAAPAMAVDSIDNRAVRPLARRTHVRDLRKASTWAQKIKTPSKWYAIDGSHRFYYFRERRTVFLPGWNSFGRVAFTVFGDDAAAAYILHGGQLTDRRPGGWMSASTIAAINFGGLEGSPWDWGWSDNDDLDLNLREVDRIRREDDRRFSEALRSAYVQQFSRALAGAR